MQRFRVNKNRNYTTIYNGFLQDKTISLKAKGLLAFILSLPEDWDLSVAGLVMCTLEGKEAVGTAIRELVEKGYINRVRVHVNGKFKGYNYEVFEEPRYFQKPDFQNSENQKTGNQKTGNPQQINTKGNNILKEESTNNICQNENFDENRELFSQEEKEEKKKSSAKKRKEAPKKISLHTACKNIFIEKYEEWKELSYYWTPADAKGLSQLIKKMQYLKKDATEQEIIHSFKVFLSMVQQVDQWVFENLSMKLLNSKFNDLAAKMRNNHRSAATQYPQNNGYGDLANNILNTLNS